MAPESERLHNEVVSLREYFDLKIAQEERLREEWRKMNDRMVEAAKGYVDAKLDKMNEMREQIDKERGNLLNRGEFTTKHDALIDRVSKIEQTLANFQGRLLVIGGVWGLIVAVVGHFWK
jgi:hypothetical protein